MAQDPPAPDRPERLLIFGAGGHAVSVASVALSCGYEISGFIDANRAGTTLCGYPVLGGLDAVAARPLPALAIAVGDNAGRQRVHGELLEAFGPLHFPCLIHASAVVSSFSTVGEGTVLMPGAVVGANTRVGRFCILNTRSSIDHDGTLADFASLAPGAVTGGHVHLGERAAVSIGATVKHGVTIGADSVVGANSYVNRDVPGHHVVYGTPARTVRRRNTGDPYLA